MYNKNSSNFIQVGAGAADDLTGAAVHSTTFVCRRKCELKRLLALISTAIVSTGAVVVAFKKYIVYGDSTGAVTCGTLSLPAGTAKDKVYYKEIEPVTFEVGDQLIMEVTTAAAGGGAAGGAIYLFDEYDSPDQPTENSKMVASS